MLEKWFDKQYICTGCDAYYLMITKSEAIRDHKCLECQQMLILISAVQTTGKQ